MLSSPNRAERKFMYKNTRDFNAAECMIWMYINNPNKIDIHMSGDYPRHLTSFVSVEELNFPEGWYYSKESKTINKECSTICVRIDIKE